MTDDQVAEITSTIGNLIRISMLIRPDEAKAASDAAKVAALEILLLDPRQTPQLQSENYLNCRLLEAFERFRLELEAVRRERDQGAPANA